MVVLEKEKKVKNKNERSKFIQLLNLAFDYAHIQRACWSPAVIVFEQVA